ncbi:hypothetical protein HK103_005103 [Boothiomyces macroporosus]|uniref:Uncharacterized protein n=1 Tax=Boothiomyces macroporosus TaxID=261099 RepID=A0AAD5Y3L0_9FUNG|nr:hypothetical protein HK103_005103 [Boothiomyces macroporosus]
MAISQHLLPIKNHAMEYISSLNQLTTFSLQPIEPIIIDQILLLSKAVPYTQKEAKKFLNTFNSKTVFKKALANDVVIDAIDTMILNARSSAFAIDLSSSRIALFVTPDLSISTAINRAKLLREENYLN